MTTLKNVKFTGSTEQLEKVVEILVGNGYTECAPFVSEPKGAIVVYDYQDFQYINSGKQYYAHPYPEQDIEKFIAQHSDIMVKMCFRDSSEGKAAFKGLEDAYDEPLITGSPWIDNDGTMPDISADASLDILFRDQSIIADTSVNGWEWELDRPSRRDILKWRYNRPEDSEYYKRPKTKVAETWELANGSSIEFVETDLPKTTYYEATREALEAVSESITKTQAIRNKYMREIRQNVYCDVYDVLRAFNVTDPCLQHLIKKALAVGQRGHKDALTDYQDIVASATRALELHEEWECCE